MGTLYYQSPDFFKICIKAFEKEPYNVVMSIGHCKIEELGEIPSNFIVCSYVPQLAILKKTSVYISHGGMGGISEAIFFHVPMILLPKTIEQQINARRMHELSASLDLKEPSASPEDLVSYTELLLGAKREKYINNLEIIEKSFKEAGGIGPAVEATEKILYEALNKKLAVETGPQHEI